MTIKRINLYFDLNRQEDKDAYNIISNEKRKTDYIINLILSSRKDNEDDRIKQLVKEVIKECNIKINYENQDSVENKDIIPNEIFDFFEEM